MTGISTCKFYK